MSKQFTINEKVFTINKLDDSIEVTVIDRLLCEEYTNIISKNDSIFNTHKIITEPKILYKVLIDALEDENENVTMSYNVNKSSLIQLESGLSFDITLTVDATYISDNFLLRLPFVEKHITPKQVIERIDYRFDQIMPQVDAKLNTMFDSVNDIVAKEKEKIIENKKEIKLVKDDLTKLESVRDDITNIRKDLVNLDRWHQSMSRFMENVRYVICYK